MSPERVRRLATDDQVAAGLRETGRPITAPELGAQGVSRFLWFLDRTPDQIQPGEPGHGGRWWGGDGGDHFHECWESGCVRSIPGGGSVDLQLLARLTRQGFVERTKVGRRVYWTWVGPSPDMTAYEAQFAAGVGGAEPPTQDTFGGAA